MKKYEKHEKELYDIMINFIGNQLYTCDEIEDGDELYKKISQWLCGYLHCFILGEYNYYMVESIVYKGNNAKLLIDSTIFQFIKYLGRKTNKKENANAEKIYEKFKKFKEVIISSTVYGEHIKELQDVLIHSKNYYGDIEGTFLEKDSEKFHKKELRVFISKCMHIDDPKRTRDKNNQYIPEIDIINEGELLPYLILFTVYYHGYNQHKFEEFYREITAHYHGNRNLENDNQCKMYNTVMWILKCIAELVIDNKDILMMSGLEVTCHTIYSFLDKCNFYEKDVCTKLYTLLEEVLSCKNIIQPENGQLVADLFTKVVCDMNSEKNNLFEDKFYNGYMENNYMSHDMRPIIRKLCEYFKSVQNIQIDWKELINNIEYADDTDENMLIISKLCQNIYLIVLTQLFPSQEEYSSIFGYLLLMEHIRETLLNKEFIDSEKVMKKSNYKGLCDVLLDKYIQWMKEYIESLDRLFEVAEKTFSSVMENVIDEFKNIILEKMEIDVLNNVMDNHLDLIKKYSIDEVFVRNGLATYLMD